jgi:hypothetical protein
MVVMELGGYQIVKAKSLSLLKANLFLHSADRLVGIEN